MIGTDKLTMHHAMQLIHVEDKTLYGATNVIVENFCDFFVNVCLCDIIFTLLLANLFIRDVAYNIIWYWRKWRY